MKTFGKLMEAAAKKGLVCTATPGFFWLCKFLQKVKHAWKNHRKMPAVKSLKVVATEEVLDAANDDGPWASRHQEFQSAHHGCGQCPRPAGGRGVLPGLVLRQAKEKVW